MASIVKRNGSYRVTARVNGRRVSKTFKLKASAVAWGAQQDALNSKVKEVGYGNTLREALVKYRELVSPTKKWADWDLKRVTWLENTLPFVDLGRSLGLAALGQDVSTQSVRLASAMFKNLVPVNPIPNPDRVDGANAIVGTIPTALSFPAEVFLNRTSFGSDMRPDYNSNPDAYKAFRGTRGTVYADIAAFLNESTGGTTRESGLIDISPETLKGFVHFTLGGTGKFVADTASTAKGAVTGDVNANKIPFVNRFAKDIDVTTYRARFYREAGEAKDKMELYNKYKKDRNSEKRQELAPWRMLGQRGNNMWERMNQLRDRELNIERDDNLTAAERKLKLKEIEKQQIEISDRFHKLYSGVTR